MGRMYAIFLCDITDILDFILFEQKMSGTPVFLVSCVLQV